MKSRFLFVVRFLALFALLTACGAVLRGPERYAAALERAAAVASPLVTGWWLTPRVPPGGRRALVYRSGNSELPLLLSLEALALGLLPLLSLLGATPGLGARRLLGSALLGGLALFLLDLAILVLYPLLVSRPGPVTDIAGAFLGLLTFVGGPVIVWFALTYRQLEPVWRLRDRSSGSRRARPGWLTRGRKEPAA